MQYVYFPHNSPSKINFSTNQILTSQDTIKNIIKTQWQLTDLFLKSKYFVDFNITQVK